MKFQDPLGDGETKAAMSPISLAASVPLIKAIENMGKLLLWNTLTRVTDLHRDLTFVRGHFEPDGPTPAGVVNRVFNKIFQHAFYQSDVRVYKRKLLLDVCDDADLFLLRFELKFLDHVLDKLA